MNWEVLGWTGRYWEVLGAGMGDVRPYWEGTGSYWDELGGTEPGPKSHTTPRPLIIIPPPAANHLADPAHRSHRPRPLSQTPPLSPRQRPPSGPARSPRPRPPSAGPPPTFPPPDALRSFPAVPPRPLRFPRSSPSLPTDSATTESPSPAPPSCRRKSLPSRFRCLPAAYAVVSLRPLPLRQQERGSGSFSQ